MSAATLLTVGAPGSATDAGTGHEEEARAPLLDASRHSSAAPSSHSSHRRAGDAAGVAAGRAAVDWRFVRRFFAMMAPLRPYAALLLVLLSLAEALVVARVGKVAGSFYKLVVDRETERLLTFFLSAAGLFVVVTIIRATNVWLSELLALRWRNRLTALIHEKYCQQQAYYWLPDKIDNPDQRITADLGKWCTTLAELMQKFCAAPLQVVYYSYLTFSYTGLVGLGIAYGFFGVGLVVQQLIISPLARLVFAQERLEGDFRAAHMRVHGLRTEVALYRADATERAALEGHLSGVITNAGRIVGRHWLLETSTKGLEYVGSLMNYIAVALAVFSADGGTESHDSGADAQLVSNASFATLTLVYAFTQLLDTAEKVSNIAGYTARVSELLEELKELGQQAERGARSVSSTTSTRPSIDGIDLSRARCSARTLIPPGPLCPAAYPSGRGSSFELSVHQIGREMVLQVADVFPDAPIPQADDDAAALESVVGQILMVPTFQVAREGIDLAGKTADPETLARVSEEMDRMLERFLGWAGLLVAALREEGYWGNAVDPRTGLALYGQQGGAYSEARGAASLLGFERLNTGVCDVISHPVHGTRVYPATLVTNAPLPAFLDALQKTGNRLLETADDLHRQFASPSNGNALPTPPRLPLPSLACALPSDLLPVAAGPLVELSGLSVDTPAGVPAVVELELSVRGGDHVLVTGPSGCGKSTLLRALAKLWGIKAGLAHLPAKELVMFVPQRGVLAPTLSLAGQLLYPSGALSQSSSLAVSPGHLRWLLQVVGLAELWDRADGDWEGEHGWLQSLSPGELQRLGIARVLARRPVLALLDESTSAVPPEVAASLYGMLKAAGVTLISVSHQPQLEALHRRVLRLAGDGTGHWDLEALPVAA